MADVTIAGGASGSDVVLSGNNALFQVTDGEVEFSTDSGTTWQKRPAGTDIVFYDGQTVKVRNTRPIAAKFSHMAY